MTLSDREELGRLLVNLQDLVIDIGKFSYRHFDDEPDLIRWIGGLQQHIAGYITIIRERYNTQRYYRPLDIKGSHTEILFRRFSLRKD